MKAIQFDRYGTTAELHLVDVDLPQPGTGRVRVRVRAAGVNALDGKIRSGAMSAVFPTQLPSTPGFEIAGVVDAVGAEVTDFAVGDEVFGWSDSGGYAEYALASTIAAKPAELRWQEAVALPVAGATATRVLDTLDLASSDTVLIHGAAGAVGTIAVQLAVSRGARVVATAGTANQDYLTSLGATATLYGEGLVERVRTLAPDGVDAVFDVAGKGALDDSITLRGGTDRIVTIADLRAAQLGVTFSASPAHKPGGVLVELAEAAAAGTLAVTTTAYPLPQAATAQDLSDAGHSRGKVVLTVD